MIGTCRERLAVRSDLGGIIGCVHQVVQVGDPCRAHGGQRNRDLAVIHRAAEVRIQLQRYPAIARVDMQLVADPRFLIALGVAFGADITGLAGRRASPAASLPADAAAGSAPSGGRSSPLRGRPRLRFGLAGCFGLGVGFSRPSIAVASRDRRDRPTGSCIRVFLISAVCRRSSARRPRRTRQRHARTSPRWGSPRILSQPHRRRSAGSLVSRSRRALVVSIWNTALAMKARASAARSWSFTTAPVTAPGQMCSTRTNSSTVMNAWPALSQRTEVASMVGN